MELGRLGERVEVVKKEGKVKNRRGSKEYTGRREV